MEEITDLQKEQNEILQLVDDNKPQGGTGVWKKYYGDIVCRILSHYLCKHLSSNLRVVGPNAYILGFPTEFDLLVSTAKVMPVKFTNAYPHDQIHCVIEVKTTGIFGSKEEFSIKVRKIRDNFQSLVKEYLNLRK